MTTYNLGYSDFIRCPPNILKAGPEFRCLDDIVKLATGLFERSILPEPHLPLRGIPASYRSVFFRAMLAGGWGASLLGLRLPRSREAHDYASSGRQSVRSPDQSVEELDETHPLTVTGDSYPPPFRSLRAYGTAHTRPFHRRSHPRHR